MICSTEVAYAHMVENMFNHFSKPEYKQIAVETLCVLAAILKRNPELIFNGRLCVDDLIAEAIAMFKRVRENLFHGMRVSNHTKR